MSALYTNCLKLIGSQGYVKVDVQNSAAIVRVCHFTRLHGVTRRHNPERPQPSVINKVAHCLMMYYETKFQNPTLVGLR
jgi:hypothetical protein